MLIAITGAVCTFIALYFSIVADIGTGMAFITGVILIPIFLVLHKILIEGVKLILGD